MCAEKSEGARYGMEALALGGLTETGPLLATLSGPEQTVKSVGQGVF